MLFEYAFPSYNERDQIQAWTYVPAAETVGVIQLIHGFGEHARRYIHMISAFLDAGFVVTFDDHVGHGKTAVVNNSWGDWGNKGPETMVQDEISLMKLNKEKFPDLPYFIYGHSMGSFIARQFIAREGDKLKGAVICGTGGHIDLSELIQTFQKIVDEGRGDEKTDPELAGAFFKPFFSRIPEVKIGNEWISVDPHVQIDHAQDPLNAFVKPADYKSYLQFFQMCEEVMAPESIEKIPKDLPLLIISGDQDPVGNFGEGVYSFANQLVAAGHTNVTTHLYTNCRHEIHNNVKTRDDVDKRIINFCYKQLGLPVEEDLSLSQRSWLRDGFHRP